MSYLPRRLPDEDLIAVGRGRVGCTLPGFDPYLTERNR
jgi:hypothetical protein